MEAALKLLAEPVTVDHAVVAHTGCSARCSVAGCEVPLSLLLADMSQAPAGQRRAARPKGATGVTSGGAPAVLTSPAWDGGCPTVDPASLLTTLPPQGLVVSRPAFLLSHHVHEVVHDAWAEYTSVSPSTPLALSTCLDRLRTARACIALYTTVVPTGASLLLSSAASSCEGGGGVAHPMLTHNDCAYLARTSARLAAAVVNGLHPCPLPSPPPLLDLVAPLLHSSHASFVGAVLAVKERVDEAWEGAPTLESASSSEGERQIRAAVSVQAATLTDAASAWSGVLPPLHYARAMGFLLDAALERTCAGVLAMRTIEDAAGTSLASILRTQLEWGGMLRLERGGGSTHGAPPLDPSAYVRHWRRAKQLATLLASSPRAMAALCGPGGEVDTLGGVSRGEAAHLVRALIDDGPDRARLLRTVMAGAGEIPRGVL